MNELTFYLNDRPMSQLTAGPLTVSAFSGRDADINRYAAACRKDSGPITPGSYFIVDRPKGGRLGWLWDRNPVSPRVDWFALFAADRRVDDISRFCADVERGAYRLHPDALFWGRSDGCVAVERWADFDRVRAFLVGPAPTRVPGTEIRCYGRLVVRRATS